MLITSITQAQRDRERVNIFLDGEFSFGIDKQTLANYMLHQGLEISAELKTEILTTDAQNYLYRKLLFAWQQKPRSQKDLKTKALAMLSRREEKASAKKHLEIDPDKILPTVFEKLAVHGCTDTSFAEWYATQRAQQGKYGPRRVVSELRAKGVDPKLTQQAVHKAFVQQFSNSNDLAKSLLLKKYQVESIKQINDFKQRAKAYRWLLSRGVTPV